MYQICSIKYYATHQEDLGCGSINLIKVVTYMMDYTTPRGGIMNDICLIDPIVAVVVT